ncbi:galactosyltransferase-related protein [Bacteroides thetaiotaomicron]|nr:galactosyltransferase-related protein [Bacteroides thetaiotaomicron]
MQEADFVYPYDKLFLDTSIIIRNLYLESEDISLLMNNTKKMKQMYPPKPVGGAFFCNLKAYKESGLENEKFYGWGMEDGERYCRWEKMGYRIKKNRRSFIFTLATLGGLIAICTILTSTL